MLNLLLVGLGGFLGSVTRYLVAKATEGLIAAFPLGTLVVNAVSALAIGFLLGICQQGDFVPERVRLFLVVGILGGLSTFSAFSAETLTLIQERQLLLAGANVMLNVGLSLACAAVGFWLSTNVWRPGVQG